MRPIDADALKDKLQQHHDFWVMAWGGFSKMPISDKKRVDEITNCIAEVVNAPTIDALSEWIPCSERLPSECDEFLITWTSSVTNGPLLAFAEYEPDALLVSGGKWYLEDDMREFKDVDVIAWMPLPKPYEEVKENE